MIIPPHLESMCPNHRRLHPRSPGYHRRHRLPTAHPFRPLGPIGYLKPTKVIIVVYVTGGCTPERTWRFWYVRQRYVCIESSVPVRLCSQILDAQKTSVNSTTPYITYTIQSGVSRLKSNLASCALNYDSFRTQWLITATRNSSRYVRI